MLGDLAEVAGAALLQEQREEVHLEEDVSELVQELGVIVPLRGVRELIGLLDRVRHDRSLVLLAVPRAFLAEPASDRVEPGEGLLDLRRSGAHRRYFLEDVEDVVAVVVAGGAVWGAVCGAVCGTDVVEVFGAL